MQWLRQTISLVMGIFQTTLCRSSASKTTKLLGEFVAVGGFYGRSQKKNCKAKIMGTAYSAQMFFQSKNLSAAHDDDRTDT